MKAMRAADLDLIFVPESGKPGLDHWQARWAAKLSSARFLGRGEGEHAAAAVARAAAAARKPIYFIAHSTGALAVVQAAPLLSRLDVRGALLVAPPDSAAWATLDGGTWGEVPRERLPFPAIVIASRTDPWASYEESQALAQSWGAELIDAGEAGRLDAASGHGPWPEGLLRLASVFRNL